MNVLPNRLAEHVKNGGCTVPNVRKRNQANVMIRICVVNVKPLFSQCGFHTTEMPTSLVEKYYMQR
jgi:hypothetical protein